MDKLFQFVTNPIRWLLQTCRQSGVLIILQIQLILTFRPQVDEHHKADNKEIENNACTIEEADGSTSKRKATKVINDDSEVFYSASEDLKDYQNCNCTTSDMPHSQNEDLGSQGIELKKDVNVGVSNVSKPTRKEANDQMQKVTETVPEEETISFTLLDLFASLMKERFKDENGLKVFIAHSEQDSDLAKFLSNHLRENKQFRAVAQDDINAELRVNTVELKIALDWADVVVIVISNMWLEECNKIANVRSTESLNTRYLNTVNRSMYLSNACLNYHLVPVVIEGTNCTYKEHPELREATQISNFPSEDELNTIGNKITMCAQMRNILHEHVLHEHR